ncbi:hypothetical protein RBI22_02240 [Alcaligenaceae bacterium C4P045]|nr:hypothetical protein [Alcaligenaceae bacterium C4P045]
MECRQIFEGVAYGVAYRERADAVSFDMRADDVRLAVRLVILALHALHASVRHCFGAHRMALPRRISGSWTDP